MRASRAERTATSDRIRTAASITVKAWWPAERFDAALLYGSAAWGDSEPGSDGDIMLLFSDPGGQRDELVRVRDATSHLYFDVVRATWDSFDRGVAGGWWLPRLACGAVLLDQKGRLAQRAVEARVAWSDPAARASRAAEALGSDPGPGTGCGHLDAWHQATLAAAHAVLLDGGVPPSGHHLLSRLFLAGGEVAANALIDGMELPRTAEDAAAQHAATIKLLNWARTCATGDVARLNMETRQAQLLRFAFGEATLAEANARAALWRDSGEWAQWGLASRDLARITVLRNVAPLLGVPAQPAALGAWFFDHAPTLVFAWWQALGVATWSQAGMAAASRARRVLARLAGQRMG